MSTRGADYAENVIRSLPRALQVMMAHHGLQGWKYQCGDISSAGNRWWTVIDPFGKKMGSTAGGLVLSNNIEKVQREIERRERLMRDASGEY